MLKYHIQTSGRSLHAQEIQFNDIRTTLQALYALFDNCNSPAHQRLRRSDHHADRGERAPRGGDPAHHQPRARAEQDPEPVAGLVHHREADRPRRRGRVQGVRVDLPSAAACSARWRRCTSAARSRKRACYYETRKHDGSLPLIGVNTFLERARCAAEHRRARADPLHEEEKQGQVDAVRAFQARHAQQSARGACSGCRPLPRCGGNVFAELMETREGLLAGADLPRALRGGRAVPAQHVARSCRDWCAPCCGSTSSARGPARPARVENRPARARRAARGAATRCRRFAAGMTRHAATRPRSVPDAAARASARHVAPRARGSRPAPPGIPPARRWRTRRCETSAVPGRG